MKSYGKLSTIFYDLDKPHPPADALTFYIQQAQANGSPILEPMCGSGRFLIPMMQAGFDLTGVDASFAMLSACQQRAISLGLTTQLVQQELHHLALPSTFRLAMIPAGSFCLLTDLGEARQALRQIFHALLPGSTFVVEVDQWLEPQGQPAQDTERSVHLPDGSVIILRSSGNFDPNEPVYQGVNRYDIIRDGQVLETEWEQFNLRYYQPESFAKLLREAGFVNIDYHNAYDPHQPEARSESLVFICTRS